MLKVLSAACAVTEAAMYGLSFESAPTGAVCCGLALSVAALLPLAYRLADGIFAGVSPEPHLGVSD